MGTNLREKTGVWKTLFFFIVLTSFFYFGLKWIDHHQAYFHRYDDPGSDALKVYQPLNEDHVNDQRSGVMLFWPRIAEFLRNGE